MRLRVSGSPRWVRCSASAWAEWGLPERHNDAATLGVLAHLLLEQTILNGGVPEHLSESDVVTHIRNVYRYLLAQGLSIMSEQTAQFTTANGNLIRGTMDVCSMSTQQSHLYIRDLKFGFRVVEPDSWQLLGYALLWISKYQIKPDYITVEIIQPRVSHVNGPYRSLTYSYAEFIERAVEYIAAADAAYKTDKMVFTPGEHCRNCKAASHCPTLRASNYGDINHTVDPEMTTTESGENLSLAHKQFELARAWFEGVETDVLHRIQTKRQYIPGWSVEHSAGRLNWLGYSAPSQLGKTLNISLEKDVQYITPTQAVDRGLPQEMVMQFATRSQGKPKLVNKDIVDRAKEAFG